MRIEIVTIFPEYITPVSLSLVGKAAEAGLLDIHVHDLRRWTRDKHRTVDDTPYGGGAGMVMNPVVWGEALDEILQGEGEKLLLIPSPAGILLNQRLAEEWAGAPHIVIACGRYEGIDARVAEHYEGRGDVIVREVSIGDYVLAGGEVAALAIVEAVARLIPGVLGNADSLAEESHAEAGLLEYPVYTKPATWRGLEVPPILLSGHHAQIAAWRRAQAEARTEARRPDLLPSPPAVAE